MAGRPRCELSDVLENDNSEYFTVNQKYIENGSELAQLNPHAEFGVPRTARLYDLLQLGEHSGCASGRARALLLISEACSENTITRVPRELANRPQPREPQPLTELVTRYVEEAPRIQDWLTSDEQTSVANQADALLLRLSDLLEDAGHAHSFEASRAYLKRYLHDRDEKELVARGEVPTSG